MTEMLIPLRSPGTAYTVEGREPEEDGLRVGAGIACVGSSGISGSIQFGGEFRGARGLRVDPVCVLMGGCGRSIGETSTGIREAIAHRCGSSFALVRRMFVFLEQNATVVYGKY
jgi:hypothetical protein